MFKVYLMNVATGNYETAVCFDSLDDAIVFASRRIWRSAVVHAPNGMIIALFERGELCSWSLAYERKLNGFISL